MRYRPAAEEPHGSISVPVEPPRRAVASLLALCILLAFLLAGSPPVAWAFGAAGATFLTGVQLGALGLVGEYVGQIYREVKGRPRYVVAERLGFEGAPR